MDTAQILNTGFGQPNINQISGLKVFPNPVKTFATINYNLANTQHADLSIYNISGQKVRTLISSMHTPGDYTNIWNADNDNGSQVANGIYFCRLLVTDQTVNTKIVVLR